MHKMKTIVEAQKKLAKVIGKQKTKGTAYRLMNYVFPLEVEEGLLLHNAITGKMILLDSEEKGRIPKGTTEYHTDLDELIQDYYLVPAEYDEAKFVEQIRTVLRAMDQNKTITGYTILPTTYCNARCYYCYEANFQHKHMTEQTANDVVNFIKNHRGDKNVSLSWFGGEPTLGAARIDQICTALAEAEIPYHSTMISNGYLFDEGMVKTAVDLWKLKRIQITLDGTEDVYNQTKAYPGVKGSAYLRVLRNIGLLLDAGVFVSIRTNLSYANADDLENLFGILKDRFAGYENFHLYSHTLFDGEGFEPVQYQNNEEELLIEKQVAFDRKIREWNKGKQERNGLPSLRFRYCMADNSSSVIINPDGEMAKCEHFLETSCGNIRDGVISNEQMKFWRDYHKLPCTDCRLYPHCLSLTHCENSFSCTEAEKNLKISNIFDAMQKKYLEKQQSR